MKHFQFDVTHDECDICQTNLLKLVNEIVPSEEPWGLLSSHDIAGEWHGAWMRLTQPRKPVA